MQVKRYFEKKVSLLSTSDVRYDGELYTVDPTEQSIALKHVNCMGTEGRRSGDQAIAPSDCTYEFIIFRAVNIRELWLLEDNGMRRSLSEEILIPLRSGQTSSNQYGAPKRAEEYDENIPKRKVGYQTRNMGGYGDNYYAAAQQPQQQPYDGYYAAQQASYPPQQPAYEQESYPPLPNVSSSRSYYPQQRSQYYGQQAQQRQYYGQYPQQSNYRQSGYRQAQYYNQGYGQQTRSYNRGYGAGGGGGGGYGGRQYNNGQGYYNQQRGYNQRSYGNQRRQQRRPQRGQQTGNTKAGTGAFLDRRLQGDDIDIVDQQDFDFGAALAEFGDQPEPNGAVSHEELEAAQKAAKKEQNKDDEKSEQVGGGGDEDGDDPDKESTMKYDKNLSFFDGLDTETKKSKPKISPDTAKDTDAKTFGSVAANYKSRHINRSNTRGGNRNQRGQRYDNNRNQYAQQQPYYQNQRRSAQQPYYGNRWVRR